MGSLITPISLDDLKRVTPVTIDDVLAKLTLLRQEHGNLEVLVDVNTGYREESENQYPDVEVTKIRQIHGIGLPYDKLVVMLT